LPNSDEMRQLYCFNKVGIALDEDLVVGVKVHCDKGVGISNYFQGPIFSGKRGAFAKKNKWTSTSKSGNYLAILGLTGYMWTPSGFFLPQYSPYPGFFCVRKM
jgi:hypothetical protein